MSTIFDEINDLGFCIYPTPVMHDVEAEANTIMALYTLEESGLLTTAGDFVVRRAAMGAMAPSLRYAPGSREDGAEARAAAYYRAANAALVRLAATMPDEAARLATSMAGECANLLMRRAVQMAREATKH